MIWRIFDFKLVLPLNAFWRREIITWPRGALMNAP
jgi:hypothetical protein